ncbi:MAG: C13 family peptidase, partial [Pseudomonadota bacterium]
ETPLPRGIGPGQVRDITNSSAVDLGNDQIVVADGRNNRVKYLRALTTTENPKAIVVAGGGPYPGNALWDATRVNANFGYRTLLNQGFDKDAVQYLSDDNADLDQNGVEDDIDAPAIGSELEAAITGAFSADATELVIYLVDHGGDDTFRLSGTETVTSTQLNEWLDTWQQASGGQRITVIYDACQSGSFVDEISAGSANRIVIASARADQSAYFVSQGALSFSNQFWTQIFNGQSLKAAYEAATEVIEQAFPTQNPILDSNGNGIGNETADFAVLDLIGGGFIGNGTTISGSRPIITSVFPPTTLANGNETVLTAFGVTDSDGVARVWATLIPPGYVPGSADNPVSELPTVNLDSQSGDDFSATFAGFSEIGTYQVVIYAEDGFGNVSVPSISTVTVNSPLQRRAVIIAGGDQSDAGFAAVSANTRLAYAALEQQGYGPDGVSCDNAICDAVQFLTPEAVAGFDATATLSNVEDAISVWGATETQDLTVYLTGPRGGGGFQLAGGDVLTAVALDGFLDIAEAANPGRVTVIVDGDLAGEFVNQLSPADGRRFLIASASGTDVAANALEGVVSFSRVFWSQTLNGATVFDAFRQARSGIRFAADCQNPEIDTDGNNVPNQLFDGLSAGAYRIGSGILLAGDDPLIESTQGPSVVTEGSAYNL